MVFAGQGVVKVDICRFLRRDGSPGDYEEVQQIVAAQGRKNLVQGVLFDALTATFLLNGNAMASKEGKDVISRNEQNFVNYDAAKICLPRKVQSLVPNLQAMLNPSVADENQKALVEKVMALSLKDRVSMDWVKTTIAAVVKLVLVVTDKNCAKVLAALDAALPPERALSKKIRGLVEPGKKSKTRKKTVCINRRIVREQGCGFSCVRRCELRRVPSQKVPVTRGATRTMVRATRMVVPAIPATRKIPHQILKRLLGASNQRYILRFCLNAEGQAPRKGN